MLEIHERRLHNPRLNRILKKNIATLHELRQEWEGGKDLKDRLADGITRWSGSMPFVAVHVLWFGAWILVNCRLTPLPRFDPFPFPLLTMIVSLEAIFLSTFVLVSQNREAEAQSDRNELDLQIDLLAEYEMTRVLTLVDAIAQHLGLEVANDPDLAELKHDVAPEAVVKELQQRKAEAKQANNGPRRTGGGG